MSDDEGQGYLLIDGAEDALVGVAIRCESGLLCAVYDHDKLVEGLMENNSEDMTIDEAREWIVTNIIGSYIEGATMPILMLSKEDFLNEIQSDEK